MKVLIIAPHHDDEAIGCGGTIAKMTNQGIKIDVAFMTAGWSGIPSAANKQKAVELRNKEAIAAGEILGINRHYFLGFEDRSLAYNDATLNAVISIIRESRPMAIWFPHKEEGDIEHAITYQIALEASWLASSPYLQELGESIPEIRYIYCYEVWTPLTKFECSVDITDFIGTKRKAIACYKSQLTYASYDKAILGLNLYRGAMYEPEEKYIEVFQIVQAPLFSEGGQL